jgi:hypothetical protein
MKRWLVIVVFLDSTCLAWGQDRPAGTPVLVEQFDGKELHGWKIDGESKIEGGAVIIGGKAESRMHLAEPLGDQFKVILEYKYAGLPPFSWQFKSGEPPNRNFFHDAPIWTELVMTRERAGALFALPAKYTIRQLGGSLTGSGSLSAPSGPIPTFELIVPAGATLTIRRIALQTTPPGEGGGGLWAALIVLTLVLGGIVALGWFFKRRGAAAPRAVGP